MDVHLVFWVVPILLLLIIILEQINMIDHVFIQNLVVPIQLLKIMILMLILMLDVYIGHLVVPIQVLIIIIQMQIKIMDHVHIHNLHHQMMMTMMKMDVLLEQPVL